MARVADWDEANWNRTVLIRRILSRQAIRYIPPNYKVTLDMDDRYRSMLHGIDALEPRCMHSFSPLQPGDANVDGRFDEADIVQVLKAATYKTGAETTWGSGDWSGAPGGDSNNPPLGDGVFDQADVQLALDAGLYRNGTYAEGNTPANHLKPLCGAGFAENIVSIVYDAGTGEVSVMVPQPGELSSIHIFSQLGIFTQGAAQNLSGPFDVRDDHSIFKASLGDTFDSLSFGNVAQAGLSVEFILGQIQVDGSFHDGTPIGPVNALYLVDALGFMSPIEDLTVRAGAAPVSDYVLLNELIESFGGSSIEFSIEGNTNPELVQATIDEEQNLDLTFAPEGSGHSQLTVRATDTCGRVADETFVVDVLPPAANDETHGGTGEFYDGGQLVSDNRAVVALGDLDGDGSLDAVLGNSILYNDGQGGFTEGGQELSGNNHDVALGDLNGDGNLDVFFARADVLGQRHNEVWLNDGDGRFTPTQPPRTGSRSAAVALGDLDGDRDLDAFVTNAGRPSANMVWLNDGLGQFTDSQQPLGEAQTWDVELGDLDGDGDLDAFATDGVWLNDGGGTFRHSQRQRGENAVALGDLDGDGDLDALLGKYRTTQLWFNDGNAAFTLGQQELLMHNVQDLTLADLDGDGDLDAFAAAGYGGFPYSGFPNRVWLNDGNGQLTDNRARLGEADTQSVGVGDVDGDGALDVVEANGQVWLNAVKPVDLLGFVASSQDTVASGESFHYTVIVANVDSSDVVSALVTDVFPPQLIDVNWTCAPTAGSNCALRGVGDIVDTISLSAGGSVTYTVTAIIDSAASGVLSNVASVRAVDGAQDVALSNNTSTTSIRILRRTGSLQPGDANLDGSFDATDIIEVLKAGKYLGEESAKWNEGDWNAAPAELTGDPPPGDGQFDQLDLSSALQTGLYAAGPYTDAGEPVSSLQPVCGTGTTGDGRASLVYDPSSGAIGIDAPARRELSSIRIVSRAGIFTGAPAENMGGSFDIDSDSELFKATFGASFGSLTFGSVAQTGLSKAFVEADLLADGSLAGGDDVGALDLIYLVDSPPCIGSPIPNFTARQGSIGAHSYVDLNLVFSSEGATYLIVANSNPSLVTPIIGADSSLGLVLDRNVAGASAITVRSTDRFGRIVDDTFLVAVTPQDIPGDANRDGRFNQLDIVHVLQGGKYLTKQAATWEEGDWNDDGVFDQLDLVAILSTGTTFQV